MNRNGQLEQLKNNLDPYDILVIGGGATGLGIAVDAASRGFRTALFEQYDFAKGTSSRSTKLVHGGVRYLAQGDISLVMNALKERGRMRKNAPHLVDSMRFIIGNYKWWERAFYTIGLTIYDLLAGTWSLGRSLPLSRRSVNKEIPTIKQHNLRGGVVYYDGQFDDARMAISLAQTAVDHGAVCLNYLQVISLSKDTNGKINGVCAQDICTGDTFYVKAKCVINATGVFVDDLMTMDIPTSQKKVRPSQGVHLVVDKKFLPGTSALMIPKTYDGRVLFGVPWHGKVVLGTTDTPLDTATLEPQALEQEIDFILDQAGQYLENKPTRADVLSVFAGLRPLAAPSHAGKEKTKEISRSHKIYISASELLTITGGKWTTYREMAEDIVDKGIKLKGLEDRPCITADLKLHGYAEQVDRSTWDYVYGSDIASIRNLIATEPSLGELLHPQYTFTKATIVWAVRQEMALTVEDILARRVRLLFLDARAAMEIAPLVASLMAEELGKDLLWQEKQIEDFFAIARNYTLDPTAFQTENIR